MRSVGIAYADSRAALEHAFQKGLQRDVLVRTSSPAVLRDPSINVQSLESDLNANDYDRLQAAFKQLAQSVFEDLTCSDASPLAIVAARAIVRSTNAAIKAMCVRETDLAAGISVIRVETGHQDFDNARNPPWEELLANCDVSIDTIPLKLDEDWDFSVDRSHPGFLGRLQHTGWPRLGFRLLERFWKCIPMDSPLGTVLVLRENPLVREAAYFLALKGFSLRSLPAPELDKAPANLPEQAKVIARIEGLVCNCVERLLANRSLSNALANFIVHRVAEAVREFVTSRKHWSQIFTGTTRLHSTVVLSNAPYRPSDVALFRVCRDLEIPFASFQHGVSKEIDTNHDSIDCLTEIASSDIFFSYNPSRSETSEKLPFATGYAVTVGLPYEYWRSGRYRPRDVSAPPIYYVSTMLFAENVNIARHASDATLADTEIYIIEKVLCHLPHRVCFKPYPEHRYLDPDPVLAAVRDYENIVVHTRGLDLAYLLPDPRVVVTARATSTLGWCLAANKPVVHINVPGQSSLREGAHEAFAQALFLFDEDDPEFHTKLRHFLSQPIEQIELSWKKKEAARQKAFEQYIGAMGPGAGRRAATHLLDVLAGRHAFPNAVSV